MNRVSADNIRKLTAAHTFPNSLVSSPPTTEEMIEQIRGDLFLRAENLELDLEKKQAETKQEEFEELIKNVPTGFRLVPVWYSKIKENQNLDVRKEYEKSVRSDFLIYLANHHEKELFELGICENGIDCMRNGFTPVDKNDMVYRVTVDHIVECSGGGWLSRKKKLDPLNSKRNSHYFLVNHLNNLILLLEQEHNFKNALNHLQGVHQMNSGESAWILMMIPEKVAGLSGFVSPPKDSKHPLYGLEKRPQNLETRINQTSRTMELAQNAITDFRDETISKILLPAERLARKKRKTVVDLMLDEKKLSVSDREDSISIIFNKAVSDDLKRKELLDDSVIPAINAVVVQLKSTFEEASKLEKNLGEYGTFVEFFNGTDMMKLRSRIAFLPIDESAQACETFREIDLDIQKRFNKQTDNKQRRTGDKKGNGIPLSKSRFPSTVRVTI